MPNKIDNSNEYPTVVNDLVEIAGRIEALTVAIAGGDRAEDLKLVESARDHGIINRIILVGGKASITRSVEEVGIEIDEQDVIVANDSEQTAAAIVELVKSGEIDVVLKGDMPTHIMNRQMLPLANRPTVSTVTLFDAAAISNGKPMILTDPGVTTVCNFGRMANLVRNAVDVAHVVMEIDRPRVAILSANEKQIASLPSTWKGLQLAKRNWPDAIVCGPLSFDLATDRHSVSIKGMPDLPNAEQVAGQADILVCPGIDTANAIYKTIAAMSKQGLASLAGVTVGFPVAYIILSRSDTLETRLNSIALCSIYSQRSRQKPESSVSVAGKTYRVLAVNPGSTSVKLAVYENDKCIHDSEAEYDMPVNAGSDGRDGQIEYLAKLAEAELEKWGNVTIDAVAGRGGFLPRQTKPVEAGAYIIDHAIISAILDHPERNHASNFGIPVAALLSEKLNVPAYTVDPVVVDQFDDKARVSGYAPITRRSTSHALSIRAAARRAAQSVGREIEDTNFVVGHLGGGITIATVCKGRITDNSIALLGGGPFTPQRAGQLPTGELIDLCYSGQYTRDELIDELTRRGGLQSYLGEYRMDVIERRINDGDEKARLAVDAMVYQILKEIGAAFMAAGCDIEAIVLTGGLTRSNLIKKALTHRLNRLAPVMVFKGSLEMQALAEGAISVLSGKVKAMHYRLPKEM